MANSIDQQFIEYIVKSLVGKPDEVKVERTVDERGVLLELTVDPEDLGRVIGKRGATAQSLRTLLRALGTKNDARYNLKIVDNGEPRPPRDDSPRDNAASPPSDDQTVSNDTTDSASDDSANDADEPVEEAPVPEAEVPAEPEEAPAEDRYSLADRTRRELADLDDLDV